MGAVAVGLPDGDDVVLAAAHDHALAHVRLLGGIDAPALLPSYLQAEQDPLSQLRARSLTMTAAPFQGALRWSPVATS